MKKLLYPIVFALTAFLILYSCSAEEEDTTPPPSIIQTPEPEPPAPTQYTLEVTAGEGGTVSTEGGPRLVMVQIQLKGATRNSGSF